MLQPIISQSLAVTDAHLNAVKLSDVMSEIGAQALIDIIIR